MVLVIKGDQHPARVHTFVSDVWDYVTVEHPCTRVGAVYLNIDGLSRSDVLGIDCYREFQWVAIKLHHFELVSMQVHGVVDLTCVDHPNQDPFVGLDLQQRVLEGLWERVAIDRVETVDFM